MDVGKGHDGAWFVDFKEAYYRALVGILPVNIDTWGV